MAETIVDFTIRINGDSTGKPLDNSDASNSIKITRLSHAIIDLLTLVPADTTKVPGAKTAYIVGLTGALEVLYGTGDRELTVSDEPFTVATGNSGGRSSRQTRRRRNGGKRNQRR